jgi:hypothetical protein
MYLSSLVQQAAQGEKWLYKKYITSLQSWMIQCTGNGID